MSKNLKTQWRVERRLSKKHKWVKKGLFETRWAARTMAWVHRECVTMRNGVAIQPVGFGNTRIVRYIKA